MDSYDQTAIVDRIYEAAVIPELWPEVLRHFAEVADSRVAALITTDGVNRRWIGCSDASEEMARRHYGYSGGAERTRRLLARDHAGFLTDLDVFSLDEMVNEPLYRDYLIPSGLGRGLATAIHLPTGESIVFNAEGDFALGPVQPSLRMRVDALRPHLARAALLSARLAFERARTAVETLAGLGVGACAVTRNGKVIVANGAFEIEGALWATGSQDRLVLHDRRADQQLEAALSLIDHRIGVRSIPLLPQGDATQPAVLHAVPVRRSVHDLFAEASAILVLTKASAEPTKATSLLQTLFDLTPVEAAIAARIAAGQTAESIAALDGKTVGTVRNQLKGVLAKMGCRRQVDLARLLTQLLPRGI